MIRQLLKDSVVYGLSSILSQGISILIVPIYTRLLSPNEYGGMDILAVFANLITLTVALEISQGLARHYPDAQTAADRIAYASTSLWFSAAAYGLFAVFSITFSKPLTTLLLTSPAWEETFRVAVIAITGNGIFFLLQNLLRWQLKPKGYAAASIAYVIISTGIGVWLVAGFHMGVIGVFYGQIVGAVSGGFLAWFLAKDLYRFIFSREKCKEMIAFSVPLIPSSISILVANYIDRFAIQNLMTLDDVGVYAVGFRFASVVNLLMVGFYGALTPLIYQHYRKDSTSKELARIFRFFVCGTLPLIAAVSLFSKEILWLFATPPYYAAWSVMPILACASVISRMYIFAPGLDIAKKTTTIALINLSAALTNIILNFIMIPHLGIEGAAGATLISAILTFAGYMILSQRYYPVHHFWWQIMAVTLISAAAVIIGLIFFNHSESFETSRFVLKLILLIGTALVTVWILLRGTGHVEKI